MLSSLSQVRFFATLWTIAHQAPLSMGFSRQIYWSGLPCLPAGDLPHPGIEPESPVVPALQADSLLLSHQGSPHRMDMQAIILSSSCRCIYMEFRKIVMTTLYARQQKRHRCIEQSFGLCGRGRGWDDLGEWH